MDAQNKPNQVFIEALSGEKQGVFVRKSVDQSSDKKTSCASEINRSITGL